MDRKILRGIDCNMWQAFVSYINHSLTSTPSVRALFLIGFTCGTCGFNYETLRTRPCYKLNCTQCTPGPACCSQDCGTLLAGPADWTEFMVLVNQGNWIHGCDLLFTIEFMSDGEFNVQMTITSNP